MSHSRPAHLLSLAAVELQSVMRCLDPTSLLHLARCCSELQRCAESPFAWSACVVQVRRLPVVGWLPLPPSRLLRHCRMHLHWIFDTPANTHAPPWEQEREQVPLLIQSLSMCPPLRSLHADQQMRLPIHAWEAILPRVGSTLRELRIHYCSSLALSTLCSAPLLSLVMRHCPRLMQLCVLGESTVHYVGSDVGSEPLSMQAYADQRRARLQIDFNTADSASGAPTTCRRVSLGSTVEPSSLLAVLQSCATEQRLSTVSELHLSVVAVPPAASFKALEWVAALTHLHTVSAPFGPWLPAALAFLSPLPEWRTINLRFRPSLQSNPLDLSWLSQLLREHPALQCVVYGCPKDKRQQLRASFDAIAEAARCSISDDHSRVEWESPIRDQ